MGNANLLNSVKVSSPGKNSFNLTHQVNMSMNAGTLCPSLVMEVIPGDSFKIGCHSLTRLQPLVTPMMSRCRVYHHYFFVPSRLLWQNWEKWITGNQGETPLPAHPYFIYGAGAALFTKLADYMGLPDAATQFVGGGANIDALPLAAYRAVYDNYYRDQNFIDSLVDPQEFILADGDNAAIASDLFQIQRRAWRHDYFTSNLPFAQKGPAVEIPIVAEFEDVSVFIDNLAGTTLTGAPSSPVVAGVTSPDVPADTLYANTSVLDVNSTTINDLRIAYRLQEWYEKQARGGSRYDENILVFFGVKTEDFRLQRPEYITGIASDVTVSEVLQTSSTDTETPQGNMAGHGYATTSGNYGHYYAKEHGWIIGIVSIMPDAMYSQGISRMWSKIDNPQQKFWPQFEHLGEQETLYREIYANGESVDDQQTWGYLPRYAEYRVLANRVAGEFRAGKSLDFWTWQRKFNARPALDRSFIECTPDYDVFAVTSDSEDHFLMEIIHDIQAIRPMGKYGTPTF